MRRDVSTRQAVEFGSSYLLASSTRLDVPGSGVGPHWPVLFVRQGSKDTLQERRDCHSLLPPRVRRVAPHRSSAPGKGRAGRGGGVSPIPGESSDPHRSPHARHPSRCRPQPGAPALRSPHGDTCPAWSGPVFPVLVVVIEFTRCRDGCADTMCGPDCARRSGDAPPAIQPCRRAMGGRCCGAPFTRFGRYPRRPGPGASAQKVTTTRQASP
jgi:hypothetical protein